MRDFFKFFVAFSENLNFIAKKWVAGCAIEWPGFSMIPLLSVWALEGWRPFRYNARGKSYSSKGCPFVLGCIERLVSPNRECAWRPSFAGSPLPARKFPSKRCHLPPPEKQPCSLVHSLVALLAQPFSLPTQSCEDKFPPFLQERCVMAVRYIQRPTWASLMIYTM